MRPFALIILALALVDIGVFLLRHHPLIALPVLLAGFWFAKKIIAHPDVRA